MATEVLDNTSTDSLKSKLDSLSIETSTSSIEDNSEIIITIRADTVIERINKFVSDNRLVPDVAGQIFNIIYHDNCQSGLQVHPSCLAFDEQRVDKLLASINVDKIPKVK